MMPKKGMVGRPAGRGGGVPDKGHGVGGSSGSGDGGGGGCILQGLFGCYSENIFMRYNFFMCGGNWQSHTPPHTLVTLEVCRRRTLEWGQKLSSKIMVCKYQKLASKKAWQPKLVVFCTKVLRTKNEP